MCGLGSLVYKNVLTALNFRTLGKTKYKNKYVCVCEKEVNSSMTKHTLKTRFKAAYSRVGYRTDVSLVGKERNSN